MQERLVHFTLFGQEFTFYSDATDEDVDAVIALLRNELEGNGTFSKSSIPSSKMLVLGCLRIAAKLIQAQREHDRYCQSHEKAIAKLIDKISSITDPQI
ncbi:cell division protein ZapA [Desulfobulbus propionicus]|jgi:cell division protein ZapA